MADYELAAFPRTWSVDIGIDGGVLTWDTSKPVAVWRINGAPVSEREAWVWIYRWHALRDRLTLSACTCKPCVWFLAERERLCLPTAG